MILILIQLNIPSFPVREVLVQEGTYETIQIPVTDLQLPEGGGYIAVRATCSELVYDRPYPDKGPWNPYANFVGYDFDKQEYTFSKVNSMYGSICFRFSTRYTFPYGMRCTHYRQWLLGTHYGLCSL